MRHLDPYKLLMEIRQIKKSVDSPYQNSDFCAGYICALNLFEKMISEMWEDIDDKQVTAVNRGTGGLND